MFYQLIIRTFVRKNYEDIKEYVFDKVSLTEMIDEQTKFFVNPTGRFVIGDLHGNTGLLEERLLWIFMGIWAS